MSDAISTAIEAMKYANERYAGDNSLRLSEAIDALKALQQAGMSDREAFEKWAQDSYMLQECGDDRYASKITQSAWEAWQAAMQHSGQGEAVGVVTLSHGGYPVCRWLKGDEESYPEGTKLYTQPQPAVPEDGSKNEFYAGVCVALKVITSVAHCGVTWAELVRSVGTDELINYAAIVEPSEWELAGFDKYAELELGKKKPRRTKTN